MVRSAGDLSTRALARRQHRPTSQVCLHSLWRRTQGLHRRAIRDDGGYPRSGYHSPPFRARDGWIGPGALSIHHAPPGRRTHHAGADIRRLAASSASLWLLAAAANAADAPKPAKPAPDRSVLASQVRTEFANAWQAYKRYAWGHDELMPLSRTPKDWHSES